MLSWFENLFLSLLHWFNNCRWSDLTSHSTKRVFTQAFFSKYIRIDQISDFLLLILFYLTDLIWLRAKSNFSMIFRSFLNAFSPLILVWNALETFWSLTYTHTHTHTVWSFWSSGHSWSAFILLLWSFLEMIAIRKTQNMKINGQHTAAPIWIQDNLSNVPGQKKNKKPFSFKLIGNRCLGWAVWATNFVFYFDWLLCPTCTLTFPIENRKCLSD